MLATLKNLPAEWVQSECSQSRYIADTFIKDMSFSSADILPMPIYCRYVPDIALCSFKRIWAAIEYLTPLAPKNSRKSSCPCKGRLRIGCWILFFLALVEAAESKSESAFSAVRDSLNIIQQCIATKGCKPAEWIRYIPIYLRLPKECSDTACRLNLRYTFKRVPTLIPTRTSWSTTSAWPDEPRFEPLRRKIQFAFASKSNLS